MIERQNWLDTEDYLSYEAKVLQLDPRSIEAARTCLRRLLIWADDTPFTKARNIEPTFPAFLQGGGIEKKALSPVTKSRSCQVARAFFTHMRKQHAGRYKEVTESWIDTIRLGRKQGLQTTLKKREVFGLEEVRQVAALQPDTLTERRDIAAVVFLLLSGMRVGAFTSLPADCVDVENLTVRQLPEMGVRTKNSKAAITYLLNIPDLLRVVQDWDKYVRKMAGDHAFWYLPLDPDGSGPLDTGRSDSLNRDHIFRRGLHDLCEKAGLPYRSPHKLRHGHAVYGVTHAKDVAEFKAVSQNLMHSNMGITDGIYGNLGGEEVKRVISDLGQKSNTSNNQVMDLLTQLAELKKNNPDLVRALLG